MDYLSRAKKFRTKKRLGQNFLVDEQVINTIISEANINPDDIIVEIGGGAGFVTEQLAQRARKVIAIELDEEAVKILKKLPIEVIHQDILKTDLASITDIPVKIVANIPYYITSPILSHLLGEIDQPEWENRRLITEIILMVQYEVAQRIVANEKSSAKDYGLLSIMVNYWCETRLICKVPANSFYPSPKVDSALVKLKLRPTPAVYLDNPALFREVTRAAFGKRRKTIKNALSMAGFAPDDALSKAGIDPTRRGETLSIEDFARICEELSI